MNLYVVRHGQTDWNIYNKIQGLTDISLNEVGHEQAEQTAKIFKNIDIEFIISSPLERALDTAKHINKYKQTSLIIDERLKERYFGDFEGNSDLSQFNCNINILLDYNKNYNSYKVEPIQDLYKRVAEFLEELKVKYCDKSILLVTHNGIIQVIESILNNHSRQDNLLEMSLNNCEYRRYICQ